MTTVTLFPKRVAAPPPPGWFSRTFLSATDTAGAVAALTNLFAQGGTPAKERIEETLKGYGVVDGRARRSVLVALCTEALVHVLHADDKLIAAGRAQVEQLATSLGLSPDDLCDAAATAAVARVRSAIKEALSDHAFSEQERLQVRSLGTALGLTQTAVDELAKKEIEPLLQSALEAAIADRRYSPAEEQSLKRLATGLGVDLSLGAAASDAVRNYRLMWEIENGQLPEIAVPISLQRKEICHYSCECSWRELRSRTVRVNYHGPTARIRIMKGVYWRVGSIAPQRVTETNLVEVAKGTLYVTSKRVILDGQAGNKSVTWRSVFGQEVFSDAIKLDKSSGRDPYLFIPPDQIEMASTIIAGALAAS